MTWTIDKTIEFGKLQRRLRNAGRVIAVFDSRATDLECEVVRGALETIDKLQAKEVELTNTIEQLRTKENELSDVSGKLQQREARLQVVELELADKNAIIQNLDKATVVDTTKGTLDAAK